MSLTIEHTSTGSQTTLTLSGVLDQQTRVELLRRGNGALDQLTDGGSLAIELAGIRFLDASGLGVLVELMNHARADGKSVLMRNPSPTTATLFRLTALDQVFRIESDQRG